MINAAMSGARLAYVVRQLPGTVKRDVTIYSRKKGEGLIRRTIEEPAGFMVYFPRGHAIRFKDEKALKHYQLDKKPQIISLQGITDPNSPLGRLMMEQDDKARQGAYQDLEQQVIALATRKTGKLLMPEQISSAAEMDAEAA